METEAADKWCIKVRHKSRGEARSQARKDRWKYKVPTRVYPCKNCLGWHVTTKPKMGKIKEAGHE
jgi:hypothetical protein